MEVSEEEFQALKVEQSILVDFAQFPDKFIELLEECISSRGEEAPRFLAVLRVGSEGVMDSSLGVVETNKFKHLSHISLRFKPGGDHVQLAPQRSVISRLHLTLDTGIEASHHPPMSEPHV